MKVGIIGAGFTGLAAGLKLAKAGHNVYIFEADSKPGGLATGFRARNWEWSLERHYHHWFTNDNYIKKLAKEINHEILYFRPKTSVLVEDSIYQLDSPLSLLRFPKIPIIDRIKTGLMLSYLKLTPFWKSLEGKTAEEYLKKTSGEASWQKLWGPLFKGKFGKYSSEIPASWFWARIKKRTPSLGYPIMGFQAFADTIAEKISKHKGKIIYNSEVISIENKDNFRLSLKGGDTFNFDKVICTLPTPRFLNITKALPQKYINSIKPLKGMGAVTLILSLNNRFFSDSTYWLNINDNSYPFLALVEHTNLVSNKHYSGENILYIGNYLDPTHEYFGKSESELINIFSPFLKRVNKKFNKEWIIDSYLFKSNFAQPIVPLNYSKHIPSLTTPIDGLFLANIQQVYPWDRGTNYAVELGEKVADKVLKS